MLNIFKQKLALINNVYIQDEIISEDSQTKNAFSEKWGNLTQKKLDKNDQWKKMQFKWYLELYGYKSETDLKKTLMN